MRSPWSFAALLAAVFAASFGGMRLMAQPSPPVSPRANASAAAFVGSAACADCHARETTAWRASQHAHAMEPARGKAVLGNFNGATFEKNGVVTTFTTRDGRYFVETAGPDGKPGTFEVAYTLGLAPLQQYLIEMPGGRLQAFGIAWDSRPAGAGGQRWFDLYPGQVLPPGDPLHWTGIQQTANFMCIDCHVTNLRKNYDAAANAYRSSWTELGVGCEACHGPGAAHVGWVRNGKPAGVAGKGLAVHFPGRSGVAWGTDPAARPTVPVPAAGEVAEVEVCARCHARRAQLTDDVHAGQRFGDGFRGSLLEPGLYRPDGQMQDEVFNHGSFLQSRMFAKGVTCANCHEPHGQKLVAEGNAVCTQCHAPATFESRAHHFHEPAGAGGQCVSCHMPVVTYMVVDPRHDHSFRVPRPDRARTMGAPDVCLSCHADKPAGWSEAELRQRLGRPPAGFQSFAEAFHAADRGAPGAAGSLARIANDAAQPPIVRASAIARAGTLGQAGTLDLKAALADPDPAVRAAAAEAAGNLRDAAPLAAPLAALLRDPVRQVRLEAARALAGPSELRLSEADRAALRAALDEYRAVQAYNADRGEGHMNLALLEIRRGNGLLADDHLKRAIAVDPTFVPASVQLADLYRARNDEDRADEILRAAIARNPESGLAHHSLGLSLVRQRRIDAAVKEFARAAELEPGNARYGYVLAVALEQTGQRVEALKALDAVLARHPYDVDALQAGVAWAAQRGDRPKALGYLATLRALMPGDPAIEQQIQRLQRR
ncbi:MAG: tetratricopeptide repeat protein [Proteobacteria bacterium]|nr:tetratricopeptide repeat protein [Pseudomonadota bacterium]